MTTKQRLASLLAASSLATFVAACGGSEPAEASEPEAGETSGGGEAEHTCGGGACGAADTSADEESGQ